MLPLDVDNFHHHEPILDDPLFKTSWIYQLTTVGSWNLPSFTLHAAINAANAAQDFNVNETDDRGRSLLMQHLSHGRQGMNLHKHSRESLLQEQQEGDGSRVVGPIGIALDLLDRGANPWVRDEQGRDALHQAMYIMWLPVLDRLLAMPGAPTLPEMEARRLTPRATEQALPLLHACAADGNVVLLGMLLERGMDPNSLDEQGRAPLFWAKHASVVTALLDHGANVGFTMPNGTGLGAYWAKNNEVQTLNALTGLILPYQKSLQAQQDPDDVRAQHMQALRELAVKGTKDNVLTHIKRHDLNVDGSMTVGNTSDEPTVPLLRDIAQGLWEDPKRSASNLTLLLEQSARLQAGDPTTSSVLFDAWVAGLVNAGNKVQSERLVHHVEGLIEQHFGWSSIEGMVRFTHDFLTWVEPKVRAAMSKNEQESPRASKATKTDVVRWGDALKAGLERTVLGLPRKDLTGVKDDDLEPGTRRFRSDVYQIMAAPTWIGERGPNGEDLAWRWASLAATRTEYQRYSATFGTVLEILGQGNDQHAVPRAAVGPHTINAIMGLMGRGSPSDEQAMTNLCLAMVEEHAPIDMGLFYQQERWVRIQLVNPLVAGQIEGLMLHQAVVETTVEPIVTPSVRRRL